MKLIEALSLRIPTVRRRLREAEEALSDAIRQRDEAETVRWETVRKLEEAERARWDAVRQLEAVNARGVQLLAEQPTVGCETAESEFSGKLDVSPRFIDRMRQVGIHLHSGGIASIDPEICLEPPLLIHGSLSGIASMGAYSYIAAPGFFQITKIGRYCSIAPNVMIGPDDHPTSWLSTSNFQYGNMVWEDTRRRLNLTFDIARPTIIGNDVWIGEGAFIRSGITIGHGAIIAARAVVTRDIPSFAIVGGVPAKVIRFRFPQSITEKLLALEWWNYQLSDLADCPFNQIELAIQFLEQTLPKLTPHRPEKIFYQHIAGFAK